MSNFEKKWKISCPCHPRFERYVIFSGGGGSHALEYSGPAPLRAQQNTVPVSVRGSFNGNPGLPKSLCFRPETKSDVSVADQSAILFSLCCSFQLLWDGG